ncbi:hypothetical protein [Streptomyces sp. UG1]|uniref:hypothetical protein n=1 Tax=Streptomyces sp. UG1 TaxID=3417652 RepID=UPI003CEAC9FD
MIETSPTSAVDVVPPCLDETEALPWVPERIPPSRPRTGRSKGTGTWPPVCGTRAVLAEQPALAAPAVAGGAR